MTCLKLLPAFFMVWGIVYGANQPLSFSQWTNLPDVLQSEIIELSPDELPKFRLFDKQTKKIAEDKIKALVFPMQGNQTLRIMPWELPKALTSSVVQSIQWENIEDAATIAYFKKTLFALPQKHPEVRDLILRLSPVLRKMLLANSARELQKEFNDARKNRPVAVSESQHFEATLAAYFGVDVIITISFMEGGILRKVGEYSRLNEKENTLQFMILSAIKQSKKVTIWSYDEFYALVDFIVMGSPGTFSRITSSNQDLKNQALISFQTFVDRLLPELSYIHYADLFRKSSTLLELYCVVWLSDHGQSLRRKIYMDILDKWQPPLIDHERTWVDLANSTWHNLEHPEFARRLGVQQLKMIAQYFAGSLPGEEE